jgi:hypothetical protein
VNSSFIPGKYDIHLWFNGHPLLVMLEEPKFTASPGAQAELPK